MTGCCKEIVLRINNYNESYHRARQENIQFAAGTYIQQVNETKVDGQYYPLYKHTDGDDTLTYTKLGHIWRVSIILSVLLVPIKVTD